MPNIRVSIVTLVVVLTVVPAAVGCGSTSKTQSKSLTISEATKGSGVVVTVSEGLARSLLEDVVVGELECGADLDPDIAALLSALDRQGRGSRVERRTDDGVLTARRSGRSLRLDARDVGGGGRLEVKMPWAVAECLLDGSASLSAEDAAAIRVKLVGSQGGSFELAVK